MKQFPGEDVQIASESRAGKRMIFFVNLPIGLLGLFLVYRHLPDYRVAQAKPLDWVGLVLFGGGVGLLSYVLEVFGEHTLGPVEVSALAALASLLLLAYFFHATRTPDPLLRLTLLRIRTLRAALSGSFVTRLGIGGMPFLLPLLYQVGLGFSAIESGLLILPQSITALALKLTMPKILTRFGYRSVLISNTLLRDGWHAHAHLADLPAGDGLRLSLVATVHQHEYSRLRRRE